ncbi:MAG: hypothetical protein RL726_1989, partial [Actinomycetota bacterium]
MFGQQRTLGGDVVAVKVGVHDDDLGLGGPSSGH